VRGLRFSWPTQIALLALIAALLLAPAGGSGSLDRAEVYFLDGARAMIERGDYLVPHYRGEPFFDKPALTYWLIAVFLKVFGPTAEAARLASALACIGVILATVWLGTLLFDRRAALASGWIVATTLPLLTFGRIAMSDIFMTCLSTLAVGLAVKALDGSAARWPVIGLGIVLGLGFLTKGPVAVLLPGLAILALAWTRRRTTTRPGPGLLALALLLFLAVSLSWYIAIGLRLGLEPLRYFFLRENLERFAASTYASSRGPWYYPVTYLAQGLPWSVFLPLAIWAGWRAPARAGLRAVRWLVAALALMLVPLSLSRGKLDYYLLPLYPLAALILGHLFAEIWRPRERLYARIACALCASGTVTLAFLPLQLPEAWLPAAPLRLLTRALLLLLALALSWVSWRPVGGRALVVLASGAAAIYALMVFAWLPAFAQAQPKASIVNDVTRERIYRRDATLVVCDDPSRVYRDLIFATRVPTWEFCELRGPASSRLPYLLLVSEKDWQSLKNIPRLRVVGRYSYLPADVVSVDLVRRRAASEELVLVANYETRDPTARRLSRQARRQRWQNEVRRWDEVARLEKQMPSYWRSTMPWSARTTPETELIIRDSDYGRLPELWRKALDTNRKEFPGQLGVVKGFGAGAQYPQIWLRDSASLLPVTRHYYPIEYLTSWIEEHLAVQEASGSVFDWIASGDRGRFAEWAPEARNVRVAPGLTIAADKNTSAADQEASLVNAVSEVYETTGDRRWLQKPIRGRSILDRCDAALSYVLRERLDARTGLVANALTADWGDVSPTYPDQRAIYSDGRTPLAVGLYTNAQFQRAAGDLAGLLDAAGRSMRADFWRAQAERTRSAIHETLWSEERGFFRLHRIVTPERAPGFPDDSHVFALGGHAVALLGSIATPTQASRILRAAEERRLENGLDTVAATLVPPYPAGTFRHPMMAEPWQYQNGGQWDWWAGRYILAEFQADHAEQAEAHLRQLAQRIGRAGGFYEWNNRDGKGQGSPSYAGSAAAVADAVLHGLIGADLRPEGVEMRVRQTELTFDLRLTDPATGRWLVYRQRWEEKYATLFAYFESNVKGTSQIAVRLAPGLSVDNAELDGPDAPIKYEAVGLDRYYVLQTDFGRHYLTLHLRPTLPNERR
jgi:4-amino-4-deoxy-L-arabinose transferase-like glycosyltransferase